MRFDYFEDLWKTYEDTFIALGIKKEDAKAVYNANFSLLKKVGEGEIPYFGYSIQYTDMTFGGKTILGFIDGYTAFKEGKVYILPVSHKTAITENTDGKAIAFGSNIIRYLKVSENGIMIEDYNHKNKSLLTRIYDKSTLEFMKDAGLQFNSIDVIDSELSAYRLLPDVSVEIKEYQDPITHHKAIVESIDNSYEMPVDFMTRPNYDSLRNATRQEMQRLDSMIR